MRRGPGPRRATRATRVALRRLALLAALAGAPAVLPAQASPYVPLDDPAYHYVDALLARGRLTSLSALERPYRVADVRLALNAVPARPAGRVVAGWERALRQAIVRWDPAPPPADPRTPAEPVRLAMLADVAVIGTAQTSGRRELMLADDTSGAFPGAQLRAAVVAGPVVAATHGYVDNRLQDDPEFAGRKDRAVSGRVEDAYVGGQWKYGEVTLGRLSRSWGPGTLDGLQLGNYVYSYDHLYARLGTPGIHLATIHARLNDGPGTFSPLVQRYLGVHRLAGRWRGLEVAATETYVYSGEGRGLEWSLANPLVPYLLTQYNEQEEGNYSVGLELAWRTRLGVLGGQLLVDDVQVDRCDPQCKEPASWGMTVTAEGLPLGGDQRWFASYTRVSSLTYRTPERGETYDFQNVGLGRGFSDYDEARVGADLALLSALPLRAYVAFRRQGEGDYRAPFPPPENYATTPGFLLGRVAEVTRLGVSGGGVLPYGFTVQADVGMNAVSGDQAVTPAEGFAGRVRVTWEPAVARGRWRVR